MSDPTTRDRDARAHADTHVPARRGNPLLWLLVLLAIVAAAWYFLGRGTPDAESPVIGETTPVPSESPVSTGPAARERPAPERVAPVEPRERPAEPIDPLQPEYPAAALRAGEEGTVLLRVDVGVDGKPTNVQVVERSGSHELDRAAERAVRDWSFQPAMRDGKAVASTVQVPVHFRAERQ